MNAQKKSLTTREIAEVNYTEWLACTEAQQWEKADIYDRHLKRLGYAVVYSGKPCIPTLQRIKQLRKQGLAERYLEAANRLKWFDAGARYGLKKRTDYLSGLLFSVAWGIQGGDSAGLMEWLEKQLTWEKEHSMPACKMLTHIQAHLLRNLHTQKE